MDGYVSTCSQKIQKILLKKDKEIPSIWSETLRRNSFQENAPIVH